MYPLGRLVEHDERSLAPRYSAERATAVHSVVHLHRGPALNQGNLGSCTGNAAAQCLNTKPLATSTGKLFVETDAVKIYSVATTLDSYSGQYPPTDTGSSGLAACKAAQKLGYITSYNHAFGLQHTLEALTLHPVIIGINWYEGMFTPDRAGYVLPTGALAGGHEVLLYGLNTTAKAVTALNSWGPSWGNQGRFNIHYADLNKLLNEGGDCSVPLRA